MEPVTPHSVETVEDGRVHRQLRIGEPVVQLGSGNAHQATLHVQPNRTGVILYRPVESVTRQSVLARKLRNMAILDAAHPTFSCDPQPTMRPESKLVHPASGKAFHTCVRCAELTIFKISDAAVTQSKPHTAPSSI